MKRGLAVLVLALAPACAKPHHARFASWEPTSPEIPATPLRGLASARLRQSRALFERFSSGPSPAFSATPGPRRYSYVRAQELGPDRISVTLFAVEGSRVVLRTVLEADPNRMYRGYGDPWPTHLHWDELFIEQGSAVGTHAAGAPALTIEELYDRCEREVLGARVDASPRLYFDPEGLLMQCGFPPGECEGCPSVSIQSLSRYSLADIDHKLPAERWFCHGDQGPVLPGASYPFALPFECRPPWPPPDPAAEEVDICRLDPRACPSLPGGNSARFEIPKGPLCMTRDHAPGLLEVGKLDPIATFRFPFRVASEIECGGPGLRYLEITPSIDPVTSR